MSDEATPVQIRFVSRGVHVAQATHCATGVTVTIWLQVLVLPQTSPATQVRVMTSGQTPFVTVLRMESVRLVPLQLSVAVGGSKLQAVPHRIVLLVAQERIGGVVSTTVTVWRQVTLFVQASVALHVRVMTSGQVPLVTVLSMVTGTNPGPAALPGLQLSVAVGVSKVQTAPH